MIWAAFSYQGYSRIAFLNGRQKPMVYCDTSKSLSLTFVVENYTEERVFRKTMLLSNQEMIQMRD